MTMSKCAESERVQRLVDIVMVLFVPLISSGDMGDGESLVGFWDKMPQPDVFTGAAVFAVGCSLGMVMAGMILGGWCGDVVVAFACKGQGGSPSY